MPSFQTATFQDAALPKRPPADLLAAQTLRQLAIVWSDFEAALERVPILQKLYRGRFQLEDYRALLRNLRQQVVDGSCWIARAASSLSAEHFETRSEILRHAVTEHRDFRMLEANYSAVGGRPEEITAAPKNIGSEAFSAWMFHRASQPDPLDLLGALFIIEGLGAHKAKEWGRAIRDQLDLSDDQVSFLLYHGDNDGDHLAGFDATLRRVVTDDRQAAAIVKTAKVTARLYRLQLEEIDNV